MNKPFLNRTSGFPPQRWIIAGTSLSRVVQALPSFVMDHLSAFFKIIRTNTIAMQAFSRWRMSRIYGDGGVDVTGATDVILVEGANTLLVNGFPFETLTFDWRILRSSNSNVEGSV